MSTFNTLVVGMWPSLMAAFGESVTHLPESGSADELTLLVDDSAATVGSKGGRIKAAIRGPVSAFVIAPQEGDRFVRASTEATLRCVEVDDDDAGGYICWCRVESS